MPRSQTTSSSRSRRRRSTRPSPRMGGTGTVRRYLFCAGGLASRTIRIDVVRPIFFAIVLGLAGCGGATVRAARPAAPAAGPCQAAANERAEELETQLALARTEVRDLRAELAA